MKKTLTAIVFAALLTGLAHAGPLGAYTSDNSTNTTVSWTHTGTTPAYLEEVHVRLSGVNTGFVDVVNGVITNTVMAFTNSLADYAPTVAPRVEKSGVVTVRFGVHCTTNSVAIYPAMKP